VRVAIAIITNFVGQWDGSFTDRAMRRWQKDEKEIKLIREREQMVPYCQEEYQMRLIQLYHLARMIRMVEINDDDVIMTVKTVTVIKEIKEVVEKSIGTKTNLSHQYHHSLNLQLWWS